MSQDIELAYVMAQKQALVQTTSTPGWSRVKQIADQIVAAAVQEALDAEDSTGEPKRLKASALKKGFNQLFNLVEASLSFNPQATDESGLGGLDTE